jgi:hypothetical protein
MLPRRREVRNRPRPPVAEAELVVAAPSVSEGAP